MKFAAYILCGFTALALCGVTVALAQEGPPSSAPTMSPSDIAFYDWLGKLYPLPQGGWEFAYVVGTPPVGAYYTSTHNVTRSAAGIVTKWFRWEYQIAQGYPGPLYLSAVERDEFDCGAGVSRVIATSYYEQNNLGGNSRSQVADRTKTPWSPAVPGTIGEMMLSEACAKPSPRGGSTGKTH
jgi:hypothetical protein